MRCPATLQAGALACARLTDTMHLLYGTDGAEGVLFWAEVTAGTDDAGEPQVFGASWWLTLCDSPEQRVQLDAPALDPDADDATRECVVTAARLSAAALVAAHRARA